MLSTTSCQLPLIFSIFSLILLYKIYEKMPVEATDMTYRKSNPSIVDKINVIIFGFDKNHRQLNK